MQNAIILLVLANLLVLMWSSFQATDAPKTFDQTDTGNLRLLTGYPGGAAHAADSAQLISSDQPPASPSPAPISSLTQAHSSSPDMALPPIQQAAAPATESAIDPAARNALMAQDAQLWTTQAEGALANHPPQPIDNLFFDENPSMDEAQRLPPSDNALKTPSTILPKPQNLQAGNPVQPNSLMTEQSACWRVGSFANEVLTRQAAQQRPQNMQFTRIAKETTTHHLGYIVIIPAKGGLVGANERVKTLPNKGIQDFQILKHGPFMHAISLGVFNQKNNAERWVSAMHRKGLRQVVMRERTDKENNYWLELESQARIGGLKLLQNTYPSASIQQIACQKS